MFIISALKPIITGNMAKKFSVPRGTADILPQQIPLWYQVENTARQILQIYGYEEIRTPVFEETELFTRSIGQSTDVVEKQMLKIVPQKERDVDGAKGGGLALRPEATASVVRAYIQHNFDKKESLSKLFYLGPMFRGERPQKGRLRQFHQIGVEVIGSTQAAPYLDAEVIALAVQILKELGLTEFQLLINTLGSLEDKESFSKLLRGHLKSKAKSLCPDCQRRLKRNVFRVLDCKKKECKEIVEKLNCGHSYLSKESGRYFTEVREGLDSLKIPYQISPKLVRGLDYYTHTVFEIIGSSLGSQDALGAGGRYNSLVCQLGGPSLDAVGFALGIERVILALPEKQPPLTKPLNVFIVTLDEVSLKRGFQLLNIWRSQKIASDMSYRTSSMKSQMRMANKAGAKYVIILGENEAKKEVVTLKSMATGTQEEVSIKGNDYSQLTNILIERRT